MTPPLCTGPKLNYIMQMTTADQVWMFLLTPWLGAPKSTMANVKSTHLGVCRVGGGILLGEAVNRNTRRVDMLGKKSSCLEEHQALTQTEGTALDDFSVQLFSVFMQNTCYSSRLHDTYASCHEHCHPISLPHQVLRNEGTTP